MPLIVHIPPVVLPLKVSQCTAICLSIYFSDLQFYMLSSLPQDASSTTLVCGMVPAASFVFLFFLSLSFSFICSFVHSCPLQHSSPIFRNTVQSLGTFPPQGGWTSLCCGQYCSVFTWDRILDESLCFSGWTLSSSVYSTATCSKKLSFQKFLLYNLPNGDSAILYTCSRGPPLS